MSRAQRIALVAVVVVGAVVAFVVLRPDGEEAATTTSQPAATETESSPTTVATTETTPTVETETETAPAAPPPPPPAQRIVVRNGEPVGGVAEIEVRKGERVRFVVVADAAEEVHVHGYDRSQEVGPGSPARFNFPATIEGVFEIELEHSAVPIAELVVRP